LNTWLLQVVVVEADKTSEAAAVLVVIELQLVLQ